MGLKVLYTSPAFSETFPGLNTDPKVGQGGLARVRVGGGWQASVRLGHTWLRCTNKRLAMNHTSWRHLASLIKPLEPRCWKDAWRRGPRTPTRVCTPSCGWGVWRWRMPNSLEFGSTPVIRYWSTTVDVKEALAYWSWDFQQSVFTAERRRGTPVHLQEAQDQRYHR